MKRGLIESRMRYVGTVVDRELTEDKVRMWDSEG